jgi:hypothetical protein
MPELRGLLGRDVDLRDAPQGRAALLQGGHAAGRIADDVEGDGVVEGVAPALRAAQGRQVRRAAHGDAEIASNVPNGELAL